MHVVNRFLLSTASVSDVKWNRHNEYEFASAHEGHIRVWDTRVWLRLWAR